MILQGQSRLLYPKTQVMVSRESNQSCMGEMRYFYELLEVIATVRLSFIQKRFLHCLWLIVTMPAKCITKPATEQRLTTLELSPLPLLLGVPPKTEQQTSIKLIKIHQRTVNKIIN